MKTAREILWQRHADAEPDLDALRRRVVAGLRAETSPGWWRTAWLELIWRPRLAWAGLAAVWLLILGVNRFATTSPGHSQSTVNLAAALRQQRAAYAEFDLLRRAEGASPAAPRPSPHSSLRAVRHYHHA